MICPDDAMQMHQKGRVGDGEISDESQATWTLQECPICNRLVVEFKTVFMVDSTEEARVRGGILVAKATEKVAPRL